MNAKAIRNLWVESFNWEGKHFVGLFGETRGNDLFKKLSGYNFDVVTFLCRECNDEEIEAFLKFER